MTNDAERRSDDGGDGVCEYCLAAADEEDDEEDDDDERRGRFEGFSGVDSLDAELGRFLFSCALSRSTSHRCRSLSSANSRSVVSRRCRSAVRSFSMSKRRFSRSRICSL